MKSKKVIVLALLIVGVIVPTFLGSVPTAGALGTQIWVKTKIHYLDIDYDGDPDSPGWWWNDPWIHGDGELFLRYQHWLRDNAYTEIDRDVVDVEDPYYGPATPDAYLDTYYFCGKWTRFQLFDDDGGFPDHLLLEFEINFISTGLDDWPGTYVTVNIYDNLSEDTIYQFRYSNEPLFYYRVTGRLGGNGLAFKLNLYDW